MFKQFGFIVAIAMVAAALFRPATGLEYSTNMEMLMYGAVAVAACLWRDYRKDKISDKDKEDRYLTDVYYQMQDYKKRNRE